MDGDELNRMVEEKLGAGWERIIRETSRKGNEQTLIFIHPEGNRMGLFVVDLDGHEMDVVQVTVDPDHLAERIGTLRASPSPGRRCGRIEIRILVLAESGRKQTFPMRTHYRGAAGYTDIVWPAFPPSPASSYRGGLRPRPPAICTWATRAPSGRLRARARRRRHAGHAHGRPGPRPQPRRVRRGRARRPALAGHSLAGRPGLKGGPFAPYEQSQTPSLLSGRMAQAAARRLPLSLPLLAQRPGGRAQRAA
jgi:hypothetical protein